MVSALADGFRKIGCSVTEALHVEHVWFDHPFELGIAAELIHSNWKTVEKLLLNGARLPKRYERCETYEERVAWLIDRHDIFVFVHASLQHDEKTIESRMGLGAEYRLLKRLW